MIPIIITGHGKFATTMKKTIEYILKEEPNLYFVDFDDDMKRKDLEFEFEKILRSINSKKVIFLTDLLGGTPFIVATLLSRNSHKYSVFSGCNLAMIIAAIELSKEEDIQNIEEMILSYARKGIVLFKKE